MNPYALITGASQGIGKSLAIELAKRSYNLLLVARSTEKLELLKKELHVSYRIEVDFLTLDLAQQGAADILFNWCQSLRVPIQILVNNAGFGLWGAFDTLPIQEQEQMIDLNVRNLTSITYRFISLLEKNDQSYLLQVASTAAYQAVPTLAVYAASKAYVLSFTRAIRHELKSKNISVTCLCPGPTETGFSDRAGMQALAKLTAKYNMSADIVARQALKAMFDGKAEVVPGFTNKLQRFGDWLAPKNVVEKIAARLYRERPVVK